jgi:hypothetical protein
MLINSILSELCLNKQKYVKDEFWTTKNGEHIQVGYLSKQNIKNILIYLLNKGEECFSEDFLKSILKNFLQVRREYKQKE